MKQMFFTLILVLCVVFGGIAQNQNIIDVKINYPKNLQAKKLNTYNIEINKSDFREYGKFFIIFPKFFTISELAIQNPNSKKKKHFAIIEWYSMPQNEKINFSVLAKADTIVSNKIKIYYGLEYQTYNQRALQLKALIYKQEKNDFVFLKDTLIYPQKNLSTPPIKKDTTNSEIKDIFDFFNEN